MPAPPGQKLETAWTALAQVQDALEMTLDCCAEMPHLHQPCVHQRHLVIPDNTCPHFDNSHLENNKCAALQPQGGYRAAHATLRHDVKLQPRPASCKARRCTACMITEQYASSPEHYSCSDKAEPIVVTHAYVARDNDMQ